MPSTEYWAGFFDGEGSVYINPIGGVQISVAQKNPEVLYLLKKDFDFGHIRDKGKRVSSGFNWTVGLKKDAEIFLNAIYPFSIVKKKEIEIGLKALSLIRKENIFDGCHPLSEKEMEERMYLRMELKKHHPNRRSWNVLSKEMEERKATKELYGYKCSECNMDLENIPIQHQVISNGKLICRKCHAQKSIARFKLVTKEEIEEALNTSDSIKEAAQKLGLARSSLGIKRKKFGLSLHPHKYLRTINRGYKEKKPVDPEKKKEWDRLYYQKHKEELIAKQMLYYERNRDKVLEYHKELYLKRKLRGVTL